MTKRLEVNPDDFVYFVVLQDYADRATNSFIIDYYDRKKGDDVVVRDRKGNPLRYKFTRSTRYIRVPIKREDEIEAIRNHPECLGSPNGTYRNIEGKDVHLNALFKEINEDKDASVAIDAAILRTDAMNKAIELIRDEVDADNAMLVLGIASTGQSGHHKLMVYAQNNPEQFLEIINSGDFKAKALVKKAISLDVLQRDGVIYKAAELEYGVDEEEVLKTVLTDRDKRDYLLSKVNN